jgi:hypothetical protein
MKGKCIYHNPELSNHTTWIASFIHALEALTLHCSLNNEFTVTATQAVPPAVRSVPHLRYLELAGNPITKLNNASFQGSMERLQELDIRHITLSYFEVKQLILSLGARVPINSFPSHFPKHMYRHKGTDTSRLPQDDLNISSSFALEIWLLHFLYKGLLLEPEHNKCHMNVSPHNHSWPKSDYGQAGI